MPKPPTRSRSKAKPSSKGSIDPASGSVWRSGPPFASGADLPPEDTRSNHRPPKWAVVLGAFVLSIALTASLGLVRQHLTGEKLPGCGGAQSACATLEAHPFGSLGGFVHGLRAWWGLWEPTGGGAEGNATVGGGPIGHAPAPPLRATFMEFVRGEGSAKVPPDRAIFPTSLLASAFFGGVLVAWLVWGLRAVRVGFTRAETHHDDARAARRLDSAGLCGPMGLRSVARLGASATFVYLLVILAANKPCPYCLAAHAANLVWWALVEWIAMKERTARLRAGSKNFGRINWAPLATGAAVFLLSAGVLGSLDAGKRSDALAKSESALADSQRQLLASANRAAAQPQAPARPFGERGFTGRWRLGPEEAVARIVLISDYQCPQCRRMENEALALVQKHPGKVSLSAKQHPNGKACNKYYTAATDVHPNACWAARAAEAAAIVAGANAALEGKDQWTAANDAFWKMHQWLFSRGGSFTDASFPVDLAALGFDAQQVVRVMQGPQTLKLIQDDIEEAQSLGINGTPMVLINGVELKGWEAPRALERAVEALIGSGAPARSARVDAPPLASEKYVADWRDQPVRQMPPDAVERSLGPKDAAVQIVVFGDFQEPNTAKVDALLRGWIDGNTRPVRYTFRHFPGDNTCNQRVSRVFFQHGCLTARAAEAAGAIGGDAAYWAMHAWLMQNQTGMSPEAVRRGAAAIGLDAESLMQAMNSPSVEQAIQDDIAAAARLNVGQIPCVYVNGKFVPRWSREGDDIMGRIVDEAAGAK